MSFLEILKLWEVYGQKVIEIIFYCTRTFVYYIYREKQILLGIWPGDPYSKSSKNTNHNHILGKCQQTSQQLQGVQTSQEQDSSIRSLMPATVTIEPNKLICPDNLPLRSDLDTTFVSSQLPVRSGRAGELVSWGGIMGLTGCGIVGVELLTSVMGASI